MANKQIKDLTEQTSLNNTDVLPLQDGSTLVTKKVTVTNIINKIIAYLVAVATASSSTNALLVIESGVIKKVTYVALRLALRTEGLIIPAATTGTTYTMTADTDLAIVNNSATIAAYTWNLPAVPTANKEYKISFRSAVTTLTVSGNGNTIYNAPTTATAGQSFTFVYNATLNAWYRI